MGVLKEIGGVQYLNNRFFCFYTLRFSPPHYRLSENRPANSEHSPSLSAELSFCQNVNLKPPDSIIQEHDTLRLQFFNFLCPSSPIRNYQSTQQTVYANLFPTSFQKRNSTKNFVHPDLTVKLLQSFPNILKNILTLLEKYVDNPSKIFPQFHSRLKKSFSTSRFNCINRHFSSIFPLLLHKYSILFFQKRKNYQLSQK